MRPLCPYHHTAIFFNGGFAPAHILGLTPFNSPSEGHSPPIVILRFHHPQIALMQDYAATFLPHRFILLKHTGRALSTKSRFLNIFGPNLCFGLQAGMGFDIMFPS